MTTENTQDAAFLHYGASLLLAKRSGRSLGALKAVMYGIWTESPGVVGGVCVPQIPGPGSKSIKSASLHQK